MRYSIFLYWLNYELLIMKLFLFSQQQRISTQLFVFLGFQRTTRAEGITNRETQLFGKIYKWLWHSGSLRRNYKSNSGRKPNLTPITLTLTLIFLTCILTSCMLQKCFIKNYEAVRQQQWHQPQGWRQGDSRLGV